MAVRFVESLDSRTLVDESGRAVGSRRFAIYNDDTGGTALTTPESVIALYGTTDGNGTNLPAKGDPFPGFADLLALSPRLRRMPGHADLWEVEWQYRTSNWVPTDLQPEEVGYVDVTTTAYGEPVDVWRTLSAAERETLFGTGGDYAFGNQPGSNTDIGGTAVDIAGVPVSLATFKVEIQLTETTDQLPDQGYLVQFLNRRNNTTFSGAPVGMVVYRGFDTARIDLGLWRVSHRFVLDPYYHLVQIPTYNPDGSVWVNSTGVAEEVYYRQPFQGGADFNAISPAIAGVI
jgi:hypothetical protein